MNQESRNRRLVAILIYGSAFLSLLEVNRIGDFMPALARGHYDWREHTLPLSHGWPLAFANPVGGSRLGVSDFFGRHTQEFQPWILAVNIALCALLIAFGGHRLCKFFARKTIRLRLIDLLAFLLWLCMLLALLKRDELSLHLFAWHHLTSAVATTWTLLILYMAVLQATETFAALCQRWMERSRGGRGMSSK